MRIGTSGFRGVIAQDFTKDSFCKIIQCTCDIVKKLNFNREIVVGYDNRFMSEIFAKWAVEVLCANDIKAKITDSSVPSPLISFVGKFLKNDISLMITASHNPYYYNGVKIFSKDGQDLEIYLEKLYTKQLKKVNKYKSMSFDEAKKSGKVEFCNYTKEYVKNIVNVLDYKKDIKISNIKTLFNVMNGSSFSAITELKKQLKLDTEIVNSKRDALFGLKGPIPDESNLLDYKKYALEKKVDFAFATDGDGDRISVLDEKGNYYAGNEIASLIYYFCIKEKKMKGAFVKNYSFSLLANKLCQHFNTKLIETPVGFKYIGEQIIKNDAILGAENSGIEIAENTFTKDGLVVYALLLEIVSFYKKPLGKIIEQMKNEIGYNMYYKEISFEVKDKDKIIEFLKENNPPFDKTIAQKGVLDGVKYIFDDNSWILIRFSGTENLIRLVAECYSKKDLKNLLTKTQNFVNNI